MEFKLSEYDSKVIALHSSLYPFVNYGTTGKTWWIKSTDYDEEFPTYKSFIRFIEDEVKYALLTYALNGELSELEQAIKEDEND